MIILHFIDCLAKVNALKILTGSNSIPNYIVFDSNDCKDIV